MPARPFVCLQALAVVGSQELTSKILTKAAPCTYKPRCGLEVGIVFHNVVSPGSYSLVARKEPAGDRKLQTLESSDARVLKGDVTFQCQGENTRSTRICQVLR